MTRFKYEDESEGILFGPTDNPWFEILTWCSDAHGQVPEQVHLIFEAGAAQILCRFTGPEALTRLIDALIEHRADVWPEEESHL